MIDHKIDWSRKYKYYNLCEPYIIVRIGKDAIIRDDAPEEAKAAFEKLMAIMKAQDEYEKKIGMSIRI